MSPGPGLEQTYDCWAAAASPAQAKARACSAFGRVTEFHSFLIAKRCLLVIVAAEVLFKFPIYPNLDAAEGKGNGLDFFTWRCFGHWAPWILLHARGNRSSVPRRLSRAGRAEGISPPTQTPV